MIVLAIGMSVYALLHTDSDEAKRLVTFYDGGKRIATLTRADTVKGALDAAGITVNPQDIVDPSAKSRLSGSYVDVVIYRSRLVAIDDGHVRQSVVTVAQSPNAVLKDAYLEALGSKDKAMFKQGDLAADKASIVLVVERAKQAQEPPKEEKVAFTPRPDALTVSKGAQIFVDSQGVAHRETYYDLPMNVVIRACGVGGSYSIRSDGAKIDQDGYVLVAANLNSYPRCTVVETSLGPAKVYDTGGFAVRHPYGFDLATDWTNYNGQ